MSESLVGHAHSISVRSAAVREPLGDARGGPEAHVGMGAGGRLGYRSESKRADSAQATEPTRRRDSRPWNETYSAHCFGADRWPLLCGNCRVSTLVEQVALLTCFCLCAYSSINDPTCNCFGKPRVDVRLYAEECRIREICRHPRMCRATAYVPSFASSWEAGTLPQPLLSPWIHDT